MSNSCKSCKGTGDVKCPKCNGKGTTVPKGDIFGLHSPKECSHCNGSGIKRCGSCKGSGKQ